MPIAEITIGTKAHGKIFDRVQTNMMIDRLVEDINEEIADYGYFLLQTRLDVVLRNPTGYYQSRIKVERMGKDRILTDSNIIYGPWLEGTSFRNQATRFKGYHSFRTVSRQLDQKKVELANPIVDRFIMEMNT
jgi:hypothetical protein